jgi:hypothetical protein
MGCDIHLFAEKRFYNHDKSRSAWVNVDKWTYNKDYYLYPEWRGDGEKIMHINCDDRFYTDGRNYNLFCALAGVRNYFENPVVISPPKGLPKDVSPVIRREKRRWGIDGHSHSWLSLRELLEFDWSAWGNTCDAFRDEVIPKLQALGGPDDARIVFWFDN